MHQGELGDKEVCLFAAYEQLNERLGQRVRDACLQGGVWPERVRRCLVALLEGLAAQPWTAQVLIRSFPALGPEALNRYQGFVEGFAILLQDGRQHVGAAEDELPTDVELFAIGSAEAIICEEIEAGRAAGLPAMAPAILFSVLVPFVGPQVAAEEMERASAAGRSDLEMA
jgi:AcrR family transcriptional regulator